MNIHKSKQMEELYQKLEMLQRKASATVAHVDRNKNNNRFSNLAALCQRCHLGHDLAQHIENRKYGRYWKKYQLALEFPCSFEFSPEYTYNGDRLARTGEFTGQQCMAVRNASGKCIRGKNGNMLVQFENGKKAVILARQLRKIIHEQI